MSTLFLDSFDHYATSGLALKYDSATGAAISSTTPRTGTSKCTLASGSLIKFISGTFSAPGLGFAVRLTANPAIETTMVSISGGGILWSLKVQTDGTLKIYRAAVLKATIGIAITNNVWYYVEFRASTLIDESFHLRINGTSVAGSTFTAGTGTSQTVGWAIASVHSSMAIDDLYLFDNLAAADTNQEFIGDCGNYCRLANAAGGFSQWTPGPTGGTNFSKVSEASQDGDTSYVETGTANFKDAYQFTDYPTTETNAAALQAVLVCKRSNATGTIGVVAHGGDGVLQTDFGTPADLTAASDYVFRTWMNSGIFPLLLTDINAKQWGMRAS